MVGIHETEKIAEVRRSRPYHALVGVGLASYGLLHLVIAWIALQLVFGKRGEASQQGALSQLARQPLGGVLLWIMAIGLFTLTVWQAVEATIGRDQGGRDGRLRRRLTSAGRAVVYLALGAAGHWHRHRVCIRLGERRGDTERKADECSVRASTGWRRRRGRDRRRHCPDRQGREAEIHRGSRSRVRPAVRRLGSVGYCVKGIALSIIGGLFVWAAVTYDPKKAGGMDAALSTIREQPFGAVLLAIMAAGIACFGVYCFFWARMARY